MERLVSDSDVDCVSAPEILDEARSVRLAVIEEDS